MKITKVYCDMCLRDVGNESMAMLVVPLVNPRNGTVAIKEAEICWDCARKLAKKITDEMMVTKGE